MNTYCKHLLNSFCQPIYLYLRDLFNCMKTKQDEEYLSRTMTNNTDNTCVVAEKMACLSRL